MTTLKLTTKNKVSIDLHETDEMWLDENVLSYAAGSIPARLSFTEAKRECEDCGCFEGFLLEFGEERHYRAKEVFQWLGY